jgi:CreA protein
MKGKAESVANHRRSCFDKLSTNGLSCKQDSGLASCLFLFNYLMDKTNMKISLKKYALAGLLLGSAVVNADEVGCVTTSWKLVGANHKVCVDAFQDPKINNVICHISQARTGGISGTLGLAEDPSQFSLSCRQVGPINLPDKLPAEETVFSENTSLLFKSTNITRLWDAKHNTLVYLAISRKVIEGAPANSVSTVPVMPWGR